MHCVSTIRRLRCATPPVIHNDAASAAILLSQNNLLRELLKTYFLGQKKYLQVLIFRDAIFKKQGF
jgi:hypothetical protein